MPFHEPAWVRDHPWIVSGTIALALVLSIGSVTGTARPTNDGLHYVNMAADGVWNNPSLAAPFAYRPGTPLLVRLIHGATGMTIESGFAVITFLAAWILLVATFGLARSMGAGTLSGVIVMSVVACSFFQVKFPLGAPTRVDVEAFCLITIAAWLLMRNRPGPVLLVSCTGLFFKEFLIIPGAVLIVVKSAEYISTRKTAPLAWVTISTILLIACAVIPRVAIPVAVGFGANFRWDLSEANHLGYVQNLRHFLFGRFDAGRLINVGFAFCSYTLPVLLLMTRARIRTTWERLLPHRLSCLVFVALVLALSAIGGTNIMIFVAYSGPVMAVVLAVLLATDVRPAEIGAMLVMVCAFNRIPVGVTASQTAEDIMSFYGGWWAVLDATTLYRSLEMGAYLAFITALRACLNRLSQRRALASG